ncbi:hypothetical protein [Sedimentitalea todarodis]|uniref:hypothetical protein n=1 Tax=Sedimentitalea todarodis TaxID=1631240 RepID=UPI00292E5CC2|nr:hypothetical protein [Sedimentitalea todarodis]
MTKVSPFFLSVLLASLLTAGCDTYEPPQSPQPLSGDALLAECIDLGFVPDTWAMSRCLKTESRVQRTVLVDQATYGTL